MLARNCKSIDLRFLNNSDTLVPQHTSKDVSKFCKIMRCPYFFLKKKTLCKKKFNFVQKRDLAFALRYQEVISKLLECHVCQQCLCSGLGLVMVEKPTIGFRVGALDHTVSVDLESKINQVGDKSINHAHLMEPQ